MNKGQWLAEGIKIRLKGMGQKKQTLIEGLL